MPSTLPRRAPSLRLAIICMLILILPAPGHAWDDTGHRLSAYVAWDLFTSQERLALFDILQQHPRFEQDFLDAMPVNVMVGSDLDKARWALGQAAVWPDIARGFQAEDLIRYHRPEWHWIDGAWVRGEGIHGNVYVGADSKPSLRGDPPGSVTAERDADNVVVALEYNLHVLRQPGSTPAERAIALCWVLHLAGDIHQPLHSGALVSRELFRDGDRGGNGIAVTGGNLHSLWDGALRSQPFDDTLRRLTTTAMRAAPGQMVSDPYEWLEESREIMQLYVYTDDIKAGVLRSERRDSPLPEFTLDADYLARMQGIAEDRLALAGLRLALILRIPLSVNGGG